MFESTLEVLTVSMCGVFNFYKDDFIHQVFDCSAGQVVSDDVLCITPRILLQPKIKSKTLFPNVITK